MQDIRDRPLLRVGLLPLPFAIVLIVRISQGITFDGHDDVVLFPP